MTALAWHNAQFQFKSRTEKSFAGGSHSPATAWCAVLSSFSLCFTNLENKVPSPSLCLTGRSMWPCGGILMDVPVQDIGGQRSGFVPYNTPLHIVTRKWESSECSYYLNPQILSFFYAVIILVLILFPAAHIFLMLFCCCCYNGVLPCFSLTKWALTHLLLILSFWIC